MITEWFEFPWFFAVSAIIFLIIMILVPFKHWFTLYPEHLRKFNANVKNTIYTCNECVNKKPFTKCELVDKKSINGMECPICNKQWPNFS